jgi:hypothetical protein
VTLAPFLWEENLLVATYAQWVPTILSLLQPQPQKASGLCEGLSAGHLIEARNAFQQVHRTWDRGRSATVWALATSFSFGQHMTTDVEKPVYLQTISKKADEVTDTY